MTESTQQSATCTDAPHVTTLRPRPAPPTSVFNPDPKQVATWRQHAEQVLSSQHPDRYDRPAAWDAFGNGAA